MITFPRARRLVTRFAFGSEHMVARRRMGEPRGRETRIRWQWE